MKILIQSLVVLAIIMIIFPSYINGEQFTSTIPSFKVNEERLEKLFNKMKTFGYDEKTGGNRRVAYSSYDRDLRNYLIGYMRDNLNLTTEIDEAGNIYGFREGKDGYVKPIVFGSHIDCVPLGGHFDGNVGVVAAIESMNVIVENNFQNTNPLQIAIFSNEEGGIVGSHAFVGETNMSFVSHSSKKIGDGINFVGGNSSMIHNVKKKMGQWKSFLELHIEQGGVLHDSGDEIGVVNSIVGLNYWKVTVIGSPNHSGTTPMDKRVDALLAASHFVISVNEIIKSVDGKQVGTVTLQKIDPISPNVVPGRVELTLEIRSTDSSVIFSLFEKIEKRAKEISTNIVPNSKIVIEHTSHAAIPAQMDERIRSIILTSAQELKLKTRSMQSGAGHDSQHAAKFTPTGMIFIPSVNGISHTPSEHTEMRDIVNGANVLLKSILKIDSGVLDNNYPL